MMLGMEYLLVQGKPMKNNYLIIKGNSKIKKVPGVNFLFPLQGFCVGFRKEYSLDEIERGEYLYLNRLLNCEDIKKLKEILPEIEKLCKGIVFEDLGVIEVLKEEKSGLEKILYASHAVCSSFTANAYLSEVDTLILSPDITLEETKEIIKKCIKPVGIHLYGNLPYMYSRRTLLKNYQTHFNLENKTVGLIKEPIKNREFLCIENEYGTVLYDPKPLDARLLLDRPNISYYYLNFEFSELKDFENIEDFIKTKDLPNTTSGFLNQKTIYQLPPKDGVK